MKKSYIILAVVIFVAVVVIATVSLFASGTNTNVKNPPVGQQVQGIVVNSPKADEVVTSPLKITGSVNGNGWVGFEGQVGTVELKDDITGNILASTYLPATTDWMKQPTQFEATLWYSFSGNRNGTLIFHNENASGELLRNKTFTVPVKLIKTSGDQTTFNVYFTNSQTMGPFCGMVAPLKRDVPKTQSVAKAALEELLKGPTPSEKNAGYVTNINEGVKLNSITIENSVAKADFSEELNNNVAGSCKVTAIRAQIEETLMQFSTVRSVVISVNGKTDILQP